MIRTPDDIKQLGTIVSLWAHPDDESFSCAGIMAMAAHNGQKVICITATRGEAGLQDPKRWPPQQLGAIREAEMAAALHLLGIQKHHWLGYADGRCNQVLEDEAIEQISGVIEQYNPDTILSFGPDGMTGHPDHQQVSSWATRVAKRVTSKPRLYHAVQVREYYEKYLRQADEELDIFYNIDEPPLYDPVDCDICVELPSKYQQLKCQALKVMPSQTEKMMQLLGEDYLCNALGIEAFVRAK